MKKVNVLGSIAGVLALASLVACTPGSPAARTKEPTGRASTVASSGEAPRMLDAPTVQMQIGTKYVRGALVRACGRRGCEDGTGRPKTLRLTDQRLLMFVLEEEPKAASVSVRRRGSGKVVASKTLRPGTTMAYVADLKNARYEVILDGEWKGGLVARWSFGLVVDEP